jgi:NAD-dependent SIR2 family protein deacetylase
MIGWRRFGQALLNNAHYAPARLEAREQCQISLTQNADRLHPAAAESRADALDVVRSTACPAITRRIDCQDELVRLNAT